LNPAPNGRPYQHLFASEEATIGPEATTMGFESVCSIEMTVSDAYLGLPSEDAAIGSESTYLPVSDATRFTELANVLQGSNSRESVFILYGCRNSKETVTSDENGLQTPSVDSEHVSHNEEESYEDYATRTKNMLDSAHYHPSAQMSDSVLTESCPSSPSNLCGGSEASYQATTAETGYIVEVPDPVEIPKHSAPINSCPATPSSCHSRQDASYQAAYAETGSIEIREDSAPVDACPATPSSCSRLSGISNEVTGNAENSSSILVEITSPPSDKHRQSGGSNQVINAETSTVEVSDPVTTHEDLVPINSCPATPSSCCRGAASYQATSAKVGQVSNAAKIHEGAHDISDALSHSNPASIPPRLLVALSDQLTVMAHDPRIGGGSLSEMYVVTSLLLPEITLLTQAVNALALKMNTLGVNTCSDRKPGAGCLAV